MELRRMYKVKLNSGKGDNARVILRQTLGSKGISKCGKYQFFIDEEVENPDFWVVRNKYVEPKETCNVAPENTVLLISEPKSIINFPQKYIDQFAVFCSCQEELKHRNIIYTPAILPWFAGLVFKDGRCTSTFDYDQIKQTPPPTKTKLISVITSNKAFTQGHQDRIDFVEKLKAYYDDKLDIFGRGINDFDDKWEVLAPYKYHISLENSSSKYYWTEKISDCYLAGTFPIYYGCTNLDEYFPESSFKRIDIKNFEEAVKIIDAVIANNDFEKSQSVLAKSKDLVLEDYNMFNMIAKILDGLDPNLPKQKVILNPPVTWFNPTTIYRDLIERNIFKLRRTVKLLFREKSTSLR